MRGAVLKRKPITTERGAGGWLMPIAFEIPTSPPSRNKLDKMHWASRDRLAQRFRSEVGAAVAQTVVGPAMRVVANGKTGTALALKSPAIGWRGVRITRRGPRALDDDNLSGGCKSLRDALKFVGLIEDDTPDLVAVEYQQERGEGCRVEVWSLMEAKSAAPSRTEG